MRIDRDQVWDGGVLVEERVRTVPDDQHARDEAPAVLAALLPKAVRIVLGAPDAFTPDELRRLAAALVVHLAGPGG